jgi:hypothetical protein
MRKVISAIVLSAVAVSANAMDPALKGALIGVGGTLLIQRLMTPSNPPPAPILEIRTEPQYATMRGTPYGVPVSPPNARIPCDEQYFEGEYNPARAFQYCREFRRLVVEEYNRQQREGIAYARQRAREDFDATGYGR